MMGQPRKLIRYGFVLLCLFCCSEICYSQEREKLAQAIGRGDLATVKNLVNAKPRLLKLASSSGYVPLHAAITSKHLDIVKYLVESGASTGPNNLRKMTAIQWALQRQSTDAARYLITLGRELDTPDRNGTTPLMYAVTSQGDSAELLSSMLTQGADPNKVNRAKQTALHLACFYQKPKRARLLIESGAKIDNRDQNEDTPLLAAARNSYELTQLLLTKGADPTSVNRQGQSVLHMAALGGQLETVKLLSHILSDIDLIDKSFVTPLMNAVYANRIQIVDFLLKQGADPDGRINGNNYQEPPILFASRQGNLAMVQLLSDAGADISVANRQREQVLHLAAQAQGVFFTGRTSENPRKAAYAELIQKLLQLGADRYAVNGQNKTPLMIATEQNFFEAVELLVDEKQPLDKLGGAEDTLFWAASNGLIKTLKILNRRTELDFDVVDNSGKSVLIRAAERGQVSIVNYLIRKNVRLDFVDTNQMTALLYAAANGHADVVSTLIAAGSDLTARDSSGQTALHMAAWNGAESVVDVLLENGSRSLARQDQQGIYTALHAASWQGHSGIVSRLLQFGFNPNAEDSDGWTPLHKAAFRGHSSVVKLLLLAGANTEKTNAVGMNAFDLANSGNHTDVASLLKQK
ncbi:MAG: ankyrin repeat domain-containing protein [Planctomycetota bacterium]